jgi:hypothetical protein
VGHERLSSILVQDEVLARFSGALLTDRHQQPLMCEGILKKFAIDSGIIGYQKLEVLCRDVHFMRSARYLLPFMVYSFS